jgi:predicted kinase
VLASVALLSAGAGYWAWSASRAADVEAARVEALRADLEPRAAVYGALRPLVRERQSHAQRVQLLSELVGSNRRLPEALWPLQAAAPAITLRSLDVEQARSGWSVAVEGTAEAPSGAAATDAVDALVQQLSSQLPHGGVHLDGLEFAPAGADTLLRGSAVAIGFRLTFTVPEPEERG